MDDRARLAAGSKPVPVLAAGESAGVAMLSPVQTQLVLPRESRSQPLSEQPIHSPEPPRTASPGDQHSMSTATQDKAKLASKLLALRTLLDYEDSCTRVSGSI